jgi:hypothetical protein
VAEHQRCGDLDVIRILRRDLQSLQEQFEIG